MSNSAVNAIQATLWNYQIANEWQFPLLCNKPTEESHFALKNYSKNEYVVDVVRLGLDATWQRICKYVLQFGETDFLQIDNFGELYEEGLALNDKSQKKSSGQYFTPKDVARIMSHWFDKVSGDAVCDVACGTGNLILAYFESIGRERTQKILGSGKLHLYDNDKTALTICVTSILLRYGTQFFHKINVHCADFLSHDTKLPPASKVISNPPYAAISNIPQTWEQTKTICETKELYAAFMEKIMRQSTGAVIITPYSFIGGNKFFPLRIEMNRHNGFVVSFDNVPGTIFSGRKHGIFNSNMGNSVRAAITVVENQPDKKGFRFSPLIRFKATEREKLLMCKKLETFIGDTYQLVDNQCTMFAKCDKRLEPIFDTWKAKSTHKLGFYTSSIGRYCLSMPNTCRYFTVAANETLERKGQITLRFDDENVFNYVYCMINSSFAYWHWRLYDGGITYSLGLLRQMPLFFDLLNDDDKQFFRTTAQEMIAKSKEYIVTKNNIGVQENIKYPRKYRDKINSRMLQILGLDSSAEIFDIVHSNMALEVSVCDEK